MSLFNEWLRVRSDSFNSRLRMINEMEDDPEMRNQMRVDAIMRHRASENDPGPELTKLPYGEFLETDYWEYLRVALLRVRGRRCQRCRARDTVLDVHHKTYAHRGLEVWYPDDLEVICRDCHRRQHGR